jgi:NitT/TauT family transport system ATP-binding protein
MASLRIEHITYSYAGQKPTLIDISWEVQRGEFHCLVGRSGCGKTSLLNIASGLLLPDTGSVSINGQTLAGPMTDAGFVFQTPTLLEWKTVLENVLFPIEIKRKSTLQEQQRAVALLAMMKIDECKDHFPRQLSGGQQSRVAIARALIKNPAFLFMDEPFAALDAITREELQDDLLAICTEQQMTVLFITHDIAEAVYLSNRVAVMSTGQIIHAEPISLARPRVMQMRYSQEFNGLSHMIRKALEGSQRT